MNRSVSCYSIYLGLHLPSKQSILGNPSHLLGHVHASDAVAVDAVVECWVFQGGVTFQLLQHVSRILPAFPFSCGQTED